MAGFFDLPRELRDQIYTLTGLSYPDMDALIAKGHIRIKGHYDIAMRQPSHGPKSALPRFNYDPLQTPAILLINRQITSEALESLHNQTWMLSTPVVSEYHIQGRGPDILNFVSEGTLQTVRNVALYIDFELGHGFAAQAWYLTIEMLLDTWYQANRLEIIHVVVENVPAAGVDTDALPEWKTAGDVIAAVSLIHIFNVVRV